MLENKLFEALLDVIPFGAYAVDVETYELVYANKIVRENMYSPQATYCWEKIYGNDEICQWCNIYKLQNKDYQINKNEKVSCEFFDEMDDRWLKSYDEIISWPDGRNVKYSILVNISDQKATQGAMIQSHAKLAVKTKHIHKTNKNLQITKLKLQKSLNEFEHLFNSTLEGILIIENKVCIDINTQVNEILGYENKEQLIGKTIDKIIDMKEQEIDFNSIDNLANFEATAIKDDEERIPVLLKVSVLDSKKQIISIVDLSEIKKKDKIINDQLRMSALEDLIINISHHWKQPLSAISTCASGMKLKSEHNDLTQNDLDSLCDRILESSDFLSKTMNSFSDFVIDNSTQEEFTLKESFDNFKNMVSFSLSANKIKTDFEFENETVSLLGSSNDLTQCFLNIFNNSIDVLIENNHEDNRYILITQSIKENNIIISFKDNGGGIKKDIDKVFEPYYTTKHQSQGTGLGLHTTYNLITKKFNGFIAAENVTFEFSKKRLEGCEIKIILPLD